MVVHNIIRVRENVLIVLKVLHLLWSPYVIWQTIIFLPVISIFLSYFFLA